ncbi:MAG: hypothetical protein WBW81_06755 [Methylocella sp.]
MTKHDPFCSPKRRLARGDNHARKLKKRVATFLENIPYERVIEKDSDGFELHKLRMGKPVPDICTDYAAEALEALRSALDQTGYAAAVLAGITKPKNAKFPFGDTPADVENDIRRGCKDLPPDIVTLFRSFQPYKGGNDALWTLNKLRNATHTILVPIGTGGGGVTIHHLSGSNFEIPVPIWNSEKNEMIVARAFPDGRLNYNFDITIFIAFGDVDFTKDPISIACFFPMIAEVKRVLSATEAECRRLGFIT